MALLNPSFDDAGALPGEAAHWILQALTSLEEIAGFGAAPEQAYEDFERWYAWLARFEEMATVRAFFDAAAFGYEDFERGWFNAVFLHELPPAQLVACTFGGEAAEDCEQGWSNADFAFDWSAVLAAAGLFDGEPVVDFEEEWRANQFFAWNWSSVTAAAAAFDGGAQSFEDFENAWTTATTI